MESTKMLTHPSKEMIIQLETAMEEMEVCQLLINMIKENVFNRYLWWKWGEFWK